jgi:hypothetical protein
MTTLKNQTAVARPRVEMLENRLVPSSTPTVDLSSHGAMGSVADANDPTNVALFRQTDAQPTGTGVINSFVRVQGKGNQAITQGYNTDQRPVEFDENTSPQFTRLLKLSDVPEVDIGGVKYREFLLDINQKASSSQLSLDELRFYSGGNNLFHYDSGAHTLGNSYPVYQFGPNDWIKLDSRLNQGSGKGDMVADIPSADFTGDYVYLYSKFGVNISANGGFEEWAAGQATPAAGSISGHVYNLATGLPQGDYLVFIDANHNGQFDSDEDATWTDATGFYSFSYLATGLGVYSTYDVTVFAQEGGTVFAAAHPDQISSVSAFVDVSLQQPGQNVTGVDFYLDSVPPNGNS